MGKKNMNKILATILLVGLFQGCATLSNSKREYIQQFGLSTRNLPDYSLKLTDGLSNIRSKRGVYFANTLSTPNLHLNELDNIYNQQKIDEVNSTLFQNSFAMLSLYSTMLLKLSSNSYNENLYDNIKELEYGLENLITINNQLTSSNIPTGFINIAAKISFLSGKYYIGYNQNQEIKRLVTSSDSLITDISNNIIFHLKSDNLNSIIENEHMMLSRNYLSYIQQNKQTSVYSDLDYILLKNNLDKIKALKEKLIISVVNLKLTHNIMAVELNKKNTTLDNINQLKELLITMSEINQIAKQIK